MKRISNYVLFFFFLFLIQLQAQLLTRTAEIKEQTGIEVGGFGNVIAGVDFDKDKKPEMYVCNVNMIDRADELIPRMYKFELDSKSGKWEEVWQTTAPLTKQNTWPAFAWGDTDKDGKPEIYWGPVNFSPYPDVARILVYEYPGDGSDNMGVADGLGGFTPNASTNIIAGAGLNIRPFRFVIADPDGDGKDELIFADRQGTLHLGILSIDNIPDLGGGKEKWTVEYSGQGVTAYGSSSKYDVAVLNNIVYIFDSGGKVYGHKYTGGAWQAPKVQTSMTSIGTFKGTVVVDIDKDGKKEILLADWFNNTKGAGAKVWLLQQDADTLKATALVDMEPLGAVRLNGADAGDIDGDGKLDFICGSRSEANNTRMTPIFRMEYQGGDIKTAANYTASVVDSAYWRKKGNMDVIVVANVDGDKEDEVLYTQGYSYQNPNDDRMPLIVLDQKYTPVSVEKIAFELPAEFFLAQNYPNPFNPTTQIKFGITKTSNVELKVFDILGKEVAVLINNQNLTAGSYNVKFDASNLSSGIYIYKLTAGNQTVSKKMQLIK